MVKTSALCAVLLLLLLLLVGCTTRTIEWNSVKYKLNSFGVKSQIGKLEFRQGTNSLTVENFQSDQVQALGIVVDKAVSAAIKSMKP